MPGNNKSVFRLEELVSGLWKENFPAILAICLNFFFYADCHFMSTCNAFILRRCHCKCLHCLFLHSIWPVHNTLHAVYTCNTFHVDFIAAVWIVYFIAFGCVVYLCIPSTQTILLRLSRANSSSGLWAHNPNVVKILLGVKSCKIMIQSEHKSAHAMTAELSLHVQIYVLIGLLHSKLKQK